MNEHKKLHDIVNKSGFPLQIGAANLVENTHQQHGWRVLYSEHAWRNEHDGSGGFIDLVLENHYRTSVLVVECKRVLESSWIFLIPAVHVKTRRHSKSWVSRYVNREFRRFDWFDLTLDPQTLESGFCVIPGQDPKSKPMLERNASDLISATEGLAWEEKSLLIKEQDSLRMYFNVILTTATLKICAFDPREISIEDGTLNAADFHEVPYLRFRKQLSLHPPKSDVAIVNGLSGLARAKENTVFVVNSSKLPQFLSEFEVGNDKLGHLL